MIDVQLGAEPTAVREFDFGEVDVPLATLIEAIQPVVAAEARVRIPLLEPLPFAGGARAA